MKILIDVPVHAPALEKLRAVPGVAVEVAPGNDKEGYRDLPPEMLRDVEVLLTSVPATNHQEFKSLKYLQLSCAGYEHILNMNLPQRGVTVCNGAGVFDTAIAEWNIMMMTALARQLTGLIDNQRAAKWDPSPRFQHEIRGSTVGFFGYGGLARATARICKSMGMQVHTLTRSGLKPRPDTFCETDAGDPEGKLPDRDFRFEDRMAFLGGVDFLVMAVPLSAATRGIVGETELRALKPTAFVLNPARGPLIEEQALLKALREKWFAGAALDTHYQYPLPPEHPLWAMPNVLMSPHISGSDGGPFYRPRVWRIFLENVERWRTKRPMLNKLTAAQLSASK